MEDFEKNKVHLLKILLKTPLLRSKTQNLSESPFFLGHPVVTQCSAILNLVISPCCVILDLVLSTCFAILDFAVSQCYALLDVVISP